MRIEDDENTFVEIIKEACPAIANSVEALSIPLAQDDKDYIEKKAKMNPKGAVYIVYAGDNFINPEGDNSLLFVRHRMWHVLIFSKTKNKANGIYDLFDKIVDAIYTQCKIKTGLRPFLWNSIPGIARGSISEHYECEFVFSQMYLYGASL